MAPLMMPVHLAVCACCLMMFWHVSRVLRVVRMAWVMVERLPHRARVERAASGMSAHASRPDRRLVVRV